MKRCGKSAPAPGVTRAARQAPPGARPSRVRTARPLNPGRPHEPSGNRRPRWMVTADFGPNRIRRTGRLAALPSGTRAQPVRGPGSGFGGPEPGPDWSSMTTTNQSIVCADCATAGHAASECPDRSASHLGADRMSAAADMLETALRPTAHRRGSRDDARGRGRSRPGPQLRVPRVVEGIPRRFGFVRRPWVARVLRRRDHDSRGPEDAARRGGESGQPQTAPRGRGTAHRVEAGRTARFERADLGTATVGAGLHRSRRPRTKAICTTGPGFGRGLVAPQGLKWGVRPPL